MNGEIAPKSIVVEAADLVSQWGRRNSKEALWRAALGASGVRTAGMQSKGFM